MKLCATNGYSSGGSETKTNQKSKLTGVKLSCNDSVSVIFIIYQQVIDNLAQEHHAEDHGKEKVLKGAWRIRFSANWSSFMRG